MTQPGSPGFSVFVGFSPLDPRAYWRTPMRREAG